MRRLMLIACAAALVTACTTGPPNAGIDPVAINAKVEQAAERFQTVRAFAELLLPFVAPETAATIRSGLRIGDSAIAAARIAVDAAGQMAALERARRETERIASLVGAPES